MFRDRTWLPSAGYTVTHVRYPTYQTPHSGLHSYADSVHPLTRAAAKVTVATTVDTRQSRSHCSTGPTLQYAINNIYRTFADKRLRNDKACCCCSGRCGGGEEYCITTVVTTLSNDLDNYEPLTSKFVLRESWKQFILKALVSVLPCVN